MTEEQRKPADAASRIGTEPVWRLLVSFSVPAIIGMLVSALYNFVDRVFVGRGVGEEAISGLALFMPLMTVSMAFAMLFGIGTANLVSMRLGQERREDAEKALNYCFWLLIAVGAALGALGLIFVEPLMSRMGAQPGSESLKYATEFGQAIFAGLPLWMLSFGMMHCTRAQGFPRVAMLSMVIPTVINTALNPLFIFALHMGVRGSALATVCAWLVGSVYLVYFARSPKAVIRLKISAVRRGDFLSGAGGAVKAILLFGSAQFFMQLGMAFVQWFSNGQMSFYGAEGLGAANGGDVALSGMNIVNTILMVFFMPIFGINQGAQPVLGFNYGAKRFKRVVRAYVIATAAATALSLTGFVILHIFPSELLGLFTPDASDALARFVPQAMRIVIIMLPVVGFQIVSSNFFVVTGRPKTAMLLTLSRQVLFLVPLIYIFGRVWGLFGVVAAIPAADALATVTTGVFIAAELRKLVKAGKEEV